MKKLLFLFVFAISFVSHAATSTNEPQTNTSSDNQSAATTVDNANTTTTPQDAGASSPLSPSMAPDAGTVEPGP